MMKLRYRRRETGPHSLTSAGRSIGSAISAAIRGRIFGACACLLLVATGAHHAAAQDGTAANIVDTHTSIRDDVEVTFRTVLIPSLGDGQLVSYVMMRKKGISRPLPVAFIYIGIPETSGPLPENIDIANSAYEKDFALRGYLAVFFIGRRQDDAEAFYPTKKYCTSSRISDALQTRADRLQAVIASVASEPAADNKHMIIVANGPAAMDSLALGSRRMPGLEAIIAIGGGIYVEGCDVISQLKPMLAGYGAKSTLSTLWIYQDNDSLYQQASVAALRDAYTAHGASVDLSFLHIADAPSYWLNFSARGRSAFLPVVDDFLAKKDLPAITDTASDALTKVIGGEVNRNLARQYISAPANKALAMSTSGREIDAVVFVHDVAVAKATALNDCRARAKGEECRIIIVNNDLQD